MNLKESFRYQNYLDSLFMRTRAHLETLGNTVRVVETHIRKKSNPDAEDEVIDVSKERTIQVPVDKIVSFMLELIWEKERLCTAITAAKICSGKDIDTLVSVNKMRHCASVILSQMSGIRPKETLKRSAGRDYRFNGEGNQVAYYYDINEVSAVDFNQPNVKALNKSLATISDETSTMVDKLMVEIEVQIQPEFDVNDTWEAALETYAAK